jgi:hypothetical protein
MANKEQTEQTERKILELIAADRFEIPVSSLSGKLKRLKPKLATKIDLNEFGGKLNGQRVYARIEDEDNQKARGMKEAIELYKSQYPQQGAILQGMIDEVRIEKEKHLYFGINQGCRLTSADYMQVMSSLGFTGPQADSLYGTLIDVSRSISRKRDEERSILIG